MILQSLYELYDRLKDDPDYQIARPGYSVQKITFKVVLRPDGSLFDIQDIRERVNGKLIPIQVVVPGGDKSTGKITANSVHNKVRVLRNDLPFLVGGKIEESTNETTGTTEKSISATTMEFEAFRTFHLGLKDKIDDPAFATVCHFLESWDPENVTGYQDWVDFGSGQGVFQILGEPAYVHNLPAVRDWWDHNNQAGGANVIAECLVSGLQGPIAPTHIKVKGVSGAQSAGASIVSFNEAAYESYGKHQSFNAPVSEDAVFRYTTALNALLDGPMRGKHRIQLGDSTVVFWTGNPCAIEDIFAQFISEGSSAVDSVEVQVESTRKRLEVFLSALRKGQEGNEGLDQQLGANAFSLLALAPNAARLSVRFFYRGTVQELLDNLRSHFEDIRILPQPTAGKRKADPEFPPTWLLLRQTARESKEIPPILEGPLLRSIITGAQYPAGLFSAVIRRIHADREINYARACIIKGYLVRNLKQEVSMSLDVERMDPAYRLGRLFATLEKTQSEALGPVNASIRDRFYSSVSATPRSVFPRLLRTYQHHLGKLSGGHKVNREKLVQEILDPLGDFPANLNLAEQGIFALGYYHQTRFFYTKKVDTNTNENEERTPE